MTRVPDGVAAMDRLHVWVDDHLGVRHVGTLDRTREAGAAYQSHVSFSYDEGLEPCDAISLLMPVSTKQYKMPVAGQVHILPPIFDQNLPEGALRAHLQTRFAKVVPEMGDFELLALLGTSNIGRVRVTTSRRRPRVRSREPIDAEALLVADDSAPLMSELIEKLAQDSGVSGVQPKVLARVVDTDPRSARLTVPVNQLIVKASGDDFPWLAANEYLCMLAAAECGLQTPVIKLSDDQRLLLVDRFDFDAAGLPLGFEDMACLTARTSNQRYDGSYEEIAETLKNMISTDRVQDALESFFLSIVLNAAIENGDAHFKNFGLIYRDPAQEVALAPAYDIVCTTAYIARDTLALELQGSKTFPNAQVLGRFGEEVCGLDMERIVRIFAQVYAAVDNTSVALQNLCNAEPDFARQCGRPMLQAWTRGMRRAFGLGADFLPSGAHLAAL